MARVIDTKEVKLAVLQRTLAYIFDQFDDDEKFAGLLDGCWRKYRQGGDGSKTFRFDGKDFTFFEYKVSGAEGDFGLQIWMRDRIGDALVFQIKDGSQRGTAELKLVDIHETGIASFRVIDEMWEEGVTSGLQDTLARFGGLAVSMGY